MNALSSVVRVVTMASTLSSKPVHFVSIFADDLGWYDTQINNALAPTPRIGKLLSEAMILDRHYAFKYCSPTRRSFLSGRLPVHVGEQQADICTNFLPLNFTLLSDKLKAGAGYACHFLGKGHLGYQSDQHLPINRGFKSHSGFLYGWEQYSNGTMHLEYFNKVNRLFILIHTHDSYIYYTYYF